MSAHGKQWLRAVWASMAQRQICMDHHCRLGTSDGRCVGGQSIMMEVDTTTMEARVAMAVVVLRWMIVLL
eukprot:3676531-Alexandrium_andersonii.AAC.1